MCGVCGLLGGAAHWSVAHGRLEGAAPITARGERARMVALLGRVLLPARVRVSDWQGQSFVLSGPTGKQEIVESLDQIWSAADRLAGRSVPWLGPIEFPSLG